MPREDISNARFTYGQKYDNLIYAQLSNAVAAALGISPLFWSLTTPAQHLHNQFMLMAQDAACGLCGHEDFEHLYMLVEIAALGFDAQAGGRLERTVSQSLTLWFALFR